MEQEERRPGFETLALHGGQEPDPTTKARAVPIYATTSYLFDDSDHAARLFALEQAGNIYTRIMNPTTDVFEKRMALLEGGVGALAVASGQAAITTALLNDLAGRATRSISATSLYGGTYNLFAHTLPRLGIKTVFVDSTDPANFRRAITAAHAGASTARPSATRGSTRWTSPRSPRSRARPACPSSSTTPSRRLTWFGPIEHGADVVIHSATKFIGGHGTSIGGVHRRRRQLRLGQRQVPGADRARPELPRRALRRTPSARRPSSSRRACSCCATSAPASARSTPSSSCRAGDAAPAHGAPQRERAARRPVPGGAPAGRWVDYPGLASHPSHALAARYHRGGFGAMVGFGIKGGLRRAGGSSTALQAVLAPGQRRRRQVAGDPPGQHHPPAADRRGARWRRASPTTSSASPSASRTSMT